MSLRRAMIWLLGCAEAYNDQAESIQERLDTGADSKGYLRRQDCRLKECSVI
jgi:hypothetical protein